MLDLDLSRFQVLVTDRLRLRALSLDDIDAVFAMRSDPKAMEFVPRPLARSLDDARALINSILEEQAVGNGIIWAITLKDDPQMIGTIGYWRIQKEHYRGELGYMLLPAHWGKGIISEAIAAVTEHGFRAIGFHSIEAIVDPGNPASMKVLEKNGFVREGWFKENFYHNGRFLDSVMYSRLSAG